MGREMGGREGTWGRSEGRRRLMGNEEGRRLVRGKCERRRGARGNDEGRSGARGNRARREEVPPPGRAALGVAAWRLQGGRLPVACLAVLLATERFQKGN